MMNQMLRRFSKTWSNPFAGSILGNLAAAKKFYRRFLQILIFRQLTLVFPWWLGAVMLALFSAGLFVINGWERSLLLGALVFMSLASLAFAALGVVRSSGRKPFCAALGQQSDVFKNLLNAIELSLDPPEDGISDVLKKNLIVEMDKRLSAEEPAQWIRFDWSRLQMRATLTLLSIFLGSFFIPPRLPLIGWNRLTHGSEAELYRMLSVQPRGGKVPLGERCSIIITLLRQDTPLPKLLVKGGDGWEEREGLRQGRETRFVLEPITLALYYKASWKNMESPVYVLEPYEPPRLSEFKVKLIYPEYTGLPALIEERDPQIYTFRGTKVVVEALATKPLKSLEMVTAQGLRLPVELIENRRVKVEFTVQNPFEFYFDLLDLEGISSLNNVRYLVGVKEDSPPQIRLLFPAQDLVAGKETRIPFTYQVEDDMGVSAVYLHAERVKDRKTQVFRLKSYSPPIAEKIDTENFSLNQLRAQAGEVIKMSLEVKDNDGVQGPKSGYSDSFLVEVQSYELEHAQIERELKEFRDSLLDTLAEQTKARADEGEMKKAAAAGPETLAQKLEEAARAQEKVVMKTQTLSDHLSGTLQKMERDPLSDFAQVEEHRAMKESIQNIKNSLMRQAQKKLTEGNYLEAGRVQDQSVAELERLSALSEEVYKYGKMKDLVHASDRLLEKGEQLNQKLAGESRADRELLNTLEETLKEAMNIIAQIQNQMQELPQELPEEFMNQPEVKNLDMDALQKQANDLSQALKRGDVRSAVEAAKQLLKKAKSARDQLAKASGDLSLTQGEELSQSVEKKSGELEQIIDSQEKLLEETGKFDLKRRQFEFEAQKKTLKSLAEKQKKAMDLAGKLAGETTAFRPPIYFSGALNANVVAQLPKMQQIYSELMQGNALFSQKWLPEVSDDFSKQAEIIRNFSGLNVSSGAPLEAQNVAAEAARELELVVAIAQTENEILEQLRAGLKNTGNPFTQQEQEDMQKLGSKQNELSRKTKELGDAISALTSKTALVDPQVFESIKGAKSEMQSAGGSLSQNQTGPAQESQEKALSYLRKGQESLQATKGQLQKMQSQNAKSTPLPMIMPRNSGNGQSGIKNGEVKIPRADDYLPPKEFREEILKSLQERYPKSEESVIKDYYRRLAE